MLLVWLLAAAPVAAAGPAKDAPEIGMLVLQSLQQWQLERDETGTRRLTGASPAGVVRDAGVSWVRVPLLNQMLRDPRTGRWTFPSDRYFKGLRKHGVKVFGTIGFSTEKKGKPGRQPFDEEPSAEVEAQWLEELRAVVTHYRGKVWIWQIGNEVEKESFGAEVYVRLFQSGSRLIRGIDPGAPIAAAGFTSGDFDAFATSTWPALLGCATPPDLLDFHFHMHADQVERLDRQLGELRAMRDRSLPAARLIVTENTTFNGVDVPYPWEDDRRITQSEADQAREQLERTAIALSHGASVSFGTDMDKPAWKDTEAHPFALNGLVYCPRRTYEAARNVRTWPKSAWWSLRLMTDLLRTRRPIDAVHQIVGEGSAPRAHLVTFRSREPIYLAWSDAPGEVTLTLDLPGIRAKRARVIEAVLPVDGKDVDPRRWRDGFSSRSVPIEDGRVNLTLSRVPVWVFGQAAAAQAP